MTTTTTVTLIIHLDTADGEVVWWAESPDFEGFTAAAPTLGELRGFAQDAVLDEFGAGVTVVERLVGTEEQLEEQTDQWGRRVRIVREQLVA